MLSTIRANNDAAHQDFDVEGQMGWVSGRKRVRQGSGCAHL